MSYSQGNPLVDLENFQSAIKTTALSNVWIGSASSALVGTLTRLMNKLEVEKNNLNRYFNALNQLEVYKQNKKKINSLRSELFFIPDTEKNAGRRANIMQQIAALQEENEAIKNEIESVMNSISSISSQANAINYGVEFNYITSVSDLLNRYNGTLTEEQKAAGLTYLSQLKGAQSLANYYSYDDIAATIRSIQTTYSGREAAVNTALKLLEMAADKNVKLDYKHQGTNRNPYVSTAFVVNGVDCNPWTAYCVDKGTPTRFQWRPVTDFYSVGTPLTNWANAQPGDVMVCSGHVGLIVENDPVNKKFVVAEAKGQAVGIVLDERSYSSLQGGGYSIMDMTNVYNGTENTDRACFDSQKDSYMATI